jgi:hypothetical protein
VAHTCNPSYSGGRDKEDWGLKPVWANSLQDPISKIPNIRVGRVSQVVQHLPSKCEALSSKPSTAKRERERERILEEESKLSLEGKVGLQYTEEAKKKKKERERE